MVQPAHLENMCVSLREGHLGELLQLHRASLLDRGNRLQQHLLWRQLNSHVCALVPRKHELFRIAQQ